MVSLQCENAKEWPGDISVKRLLHKYHKQIGDSSLGQILHRNRFPYNGLLQDFSVTTGKWVSKEILKVFLYSVDTLIVCQCTMKTFPQISQTGFSSVGTLRAAMFVYFQRTF